MTIYKIGKFLNIYSKVKLFVKNNDNIDNIKEAIDEFLNYINDNQNMIDTIIELYLPELYYIHIKLVKDKVILDKISIKKIKQLRSIHDKLFKKFNMTYMNKKFLQVSTILFTEFCKGITYFKDSETSLVPIYHREESCGEKLKNHIEKFAILPDDNSIIINKKKNAVRKCYIERKIYDIIYSRINELQEVRHLVELKNIERLYQDYFTNESIDVTIKFKNDLYPKVLTLIIKTNDDILIETYTKTNKNVKCTKELNGKKYNKEQTFDKETNWKVIINLYQQNLHF